MQNKKNFKPRSIKTEYSALSEDQIKLLEQFKKNLKPENIKQNGKENDKNNK